MQEPSKTPPNARAIYLPLAIVTIALVAPIIPLAIWGESFDAPIERALQAAGSPRQLATLIILALASDILLPIPSSAVSTLAGSLLGVGWGTAASWFGLTLGATLGYCLARWLGRPIAQRFARADDLARLDSLAERLGPVVLVVARAIPVLAEASVLVFGAAKLSFVRFIVPVALANLGISLGYAALGKLASEYEALPAAIGISISLPVVLLMGARRWLSRREKEFANDNR